MIYRKLHSETANHVIDQCEAENIDYDVWNAEDVLFSDAEQVELGLAEKDWEKLGYGP
jgi:hypothetical protein